MKLNKKQTKKMLSIKRILEDCYYNGNLRKYGLTPYSLDDLMRCYNGIIETIEHEGLAMCSEVKVIFERKGFLIREEGIGWYISIE